MGQDGTSGRYFVDALHPGRIAGYQSTTETALNRVVLDWQHGTQDDSPHRLVRAEGDGPANDKDADDAYEETGYVYGYFFNTFGRDGIDGYGGDLESHVHYGKSFKNAFWNGRFMTYGDGMLSQDVTGHEITHGVTERTAGLHYSFEAGALDESISDFFGEMTEYYRKGSNDWLVGSDLTASKPVRNMANPRAYRQPQTMKEYVKTCEDHGGVHKNSGIPNYAFYRMATGIGRVPTAKILYHAMTQYLVPYSAFRDFYSAMVSSAVDLYGTNSIWTSAVSSILKSVGINLNTPDPRETACSGSTTVTCSTLDTLYSNADALKGNGARLEDVAGSLIHMYNEGVINPSPAVTYYENLYMENRSEVEGTVELEGPLLDQFVQTVQTWEPVLNAFGTPEQGNVIVTQEEIDSANAFADALVVAANDQGKPELARLVTEERGKFDAQLVVGMNLIDAQTYMDDVVKNIEKEQNTPGPAAASLASTFDNVAVTADDDTSPGNIDGGGASFSAKALSDAGVTAGSTVAHSGVALSWPSTSGSGEADNTLADGQTIALNGTGNTLGFLVSATYGPVGGTGRVYYSDGSSQPFALSSPDWFGGDGEVAVTTAYQNRQDNQTYAHPAYVYYVGVPLQGGKTPVSVQLPKVSSPVVKTVPALHVFAMGLGDTAPSFASTFNSVAVTQDDSTDVGDIDGGDR
ncbi:M4 family metallopeptidase, partial [Streptomyces violaceoruber]